MGKTPSSHIIILGDPGAVSRVDKMFVAKVYCKVETRLDLTVNFRHEHFIDPTNCPWVSEDGSQGTSHFKNFVSSRNVRDDTTNIFKSCVTTEPFPL